MLFNSKKKSRKNPSGCRFLTEEMILREGIEDAKALRRGERTVFGPLSKNSTDELMWSLSQTKYEITTQPINDTKLSFNVTVRRRTMSEERHAKKNPPRMETCRIVGYADLATSEW